MHTHNFYYVCMCLYVCTCVYTFVLVLCACVCACGYIVHIFLLCFLFCPYGFFVDRELLSRIRRATGGRYNLCLECSAAIYLRCCIPTFVCFLFFFSDTSSS